MPPPPLPGVPPPFSSRRPPTHPRKKTVSLISYTFKQAPRGVLTLMPISFRRCIALRADRHDDGHDVAHLRVRAALEDDFHHFRVELEIRDGRITSIQAEAPRHPYSLCPAAAQALQALQGSAPSRQAHSVHRVVDPSQQCTHLLDLAGLAGAAAARGLAHRRYDIEVPMRVAGRTRTTLARRR